MIGFGDFELGWVGRVDLEVERRGRGEEMRERGEKEDRGVDIVSFAAYIWNLDGKNERIERVKKEKRRDRIRGRGNRKRGGLERILSGLIILRLCEKE